MAGMIKSPEDIKKELEAPIDVHYHDDPEPRLTPRVLAELIWLHADASAYIWRLEADNAKKDETIQMLQNGNASLMNMIDEECEKTVRLELERDAAVTDLSCNWKCAICKNFVKPIDKCPYYRECGLCYTHFEWRGVSEKEE